MWYSYPDNLTRNELVYCLSSLPYWMRWGYSVQCIGTKSLILKPVHFDPRIWLASLLYWILRIPIGTAPYYFSVWCFRRFIRPFRTPIHEWAALLNRRDYLREAITNIDARISSPSFKHKNEPPLRFHGCWLLSLKGPSLPQPNRESQVNFVSSFARQWSSSSYAHSYQWRATNGHSD